MKDRARSLPNLSRFMTMKLIMIEDSLVSSSFVDNLSRA